jgi:arylsulfatase
MHQAWSSGAEGFVRMFQRHMKRKAKYPDEGPATGMQYKGIENPRPESDAAVHELFS